MPGHQIELPPDMPKSMRYQLPRDEVGRPVPFFVEYIDGKPDFRVMNHRNMMRCVRENLCWVCGAKLTRSTGTFTVGPMCIINGTSAEPPSHFPCSEWSAKACPFLTTPAKVRRESNMPGEVTVLAGISIDRNPGVAALAVCDQWTIIQPSPSGLLWKFIPKQVDWLCQGRPATPEEVWWSVETGIENLIQVADQQDADEGARASRAALAHVTKTQLDKWFPPRPELEYPTIDSALAGSP